MLGEANLVVFPKSSSSFQIKASLNERKILKEETLTLERPYLRKCPLFEVSFCPWSFCPVMFVPILFVLHINLKEYFILQYQHYFMN